MPQIEIPNGWTPRHYQKPLWRHLEAGGKRGIYTWHRRSGKDDVGLHWTACSAIDRVGSYWYLLPMASQARKAIWDAVNPHTGKKRIDEAFPPEIRKVTRNNEMFIEFKTGSTWQVVGSDNFNSLVGAPPVGCVFSEWSLSNPSAWSYIRPIFAENGGWALFNFTPRGRNHAVAMFEGAKNDPAWFCQKLTVEDTGVFSKEVLDQELREYIREMGDEEDGEAKFRQEYYCDFNAPLIGSYYAKHISQLEHAGQITRVPYDPSLPVYTAQDIGRSDDFACWFYQCPPLRIHVIDYFSSAGQDVKTVVKMLNSKPYVYGKPNERPHAVPWDAVPETFASPLSAIAQYEGLGIKTRVIPGLDHQDQVQAARAILPRCYFDEEKCKNGLESLRQFQREWDDDKKAFKAKYLHNWASHGAFAFQYLALAYKEQNPSAFKAPSFGPPTLEEVWERQGTMSHEARL